MVRLGAGRRVLWALFVAVTAIGLCQLTVRRHAEASSAEPPGPPAHVCRSPSESSHQSSAVHRASLIVTFGSEPTKTFCIEFTESSISALDLLERSGLKVVVSGGNIGSAVCRIDDVGSSDPSTYSSCFADSPDYWALYRWANGVWQLSPIGASSVTITDGGVSGWAWGNNARPDSPLGVCPAATPTPMLVAATPRPSSTRVADTALPSAVGSPGSGEAAPAPTDSLPNPLLTVSAQEEVLPVTPEASVSPSPATPGVTSSPTAEAGVIVSPAEGLGNAARSQKIPRASNGGGVPVRLVAFAIVVVALVLFVATRVLRRRHAG